MSGLILLLFFGMYFFVIIGGIRYYMRQPMGRRGTFPFIAVTVAGAWMIHLLYLIPLVIISSNADHYFPGVPTGVLNIRVNAVYMLVPVLITGLIVLLNRLYASKKGKSINRHCLAWFIVSVSWMVLTLIEYLIVWIGLEFLYWDFP